MSKKSPWLYHFEISRMIEEEVEIDPITNEDGEEIKQFKKVQKDTPVKCAIKKPNRALYEAGELFYSVELSKMIQAGMLTKTLLAKRFADDGGTLTKHDQEHYAKLYSQLHMKETEIQRLQLEEGSAKKRAKKLQQLIIEITSIRQDLVEFESTQSALFDQTAEHKARNKTILWWVLHLACVKDIGDTEHKDLFAGEDYDAKIKSYDAIEEGEEYDKGGEQEYLGIALKKFAYFISFWYSGQAADKAGFDAAAELIEQVDMFSTEDEEVDTKSPLSSAIETERELSKQAEQEEVEAILEEAEIQATEDKIEQELAGKVTVDPQESQIKLSDIQKEIQKERDLEEASKETAEDEKIPSEDSENDE